MTATPFDYHAPTHLDDALRSLAAPGRLTLPLAGGQSLVPLLTRRDIRPDTVVDLNGITELARTAIGPHEITVGAMTRLRDLERDEELAAALPILRRAATLVAHPHIRARSTLGGSLCHAAVGAELPAVAVATGARVILRSTRGARSIPAARFITGPSTTARAPDEVVTDIAFPRPGTLHYAFSELCTRGTTGYPVSGVCVALETRDGRITAARVVASGCGPTPLRLPGVESFLTGRTTTGPHPGLVAQLTDETVHTAGTREREYQAEVAGVLLTRTLATWAGKDPR
ncbi:FAD binding domain-containing protein [Streptomyces sp. NPDC057638]|uniref:FAD binding domain-containing protein n=1 Tax=Streptomyces sp. NPDC057638 TaxID=3346190 RepID=UPI003678ED21